MNRTEAWLHRTLSGLDGWRDDDDDGEVVERALAGVDALAAARALPAAEAAAWRLRLAEAPWLGRVDVHELGSYGGTAYALLEPLGPEDAELHERLAALGRHTEVRDVLVARGPERHDGLAIWAVVLRDGAIEVLFHHVDHAEVPSGSTRATHEAFRATVDALVAPALTDDAGTAYPPALEHAVRSHGTGGIPEQGRPRVTTGVWRYEGFAPEGVRAFTVARGAARWTLRR